MAIDFSAIELMPASEFHREFSYQVKKAAEGDYITQIWGWDEALQKKYHREAWEQNKPFIIQYGGNDIGTISITETDEYIKIGQFFILPEYQNNGIGSYLLKTILDKADQKLKMSKLACLENNPAVALYKRFGFELTGNKDRFIYMERKPAGIIT